MTPYCVVCKQNNTYLRRSLTQTILPIIPEGATSINDVLAVVQNENTWEYFFGIWPIYSHEADNVSAFRYICAQLIISGVCRQCELVKTLGTNRKRLNRAVKQLNERGIGSFFQRADRPSRGTVLTPEKLAQAQALLNSNVDRRSVCDELYVDYSTLSKAIGDTRLSENKDHVPDPPASTLSDRSQADVDVSEAIGVACTRPDERLAAALGLVNGVPSTFEPCLDVVNGGVLCALPALIANGLLSKLDKLGVIEGFYSKVQVMLVLAFMLLCRFKNIEQLQGASPGEFGKLVGQPKFGRGYGW